MREPSEQCFTRDECTKKVDKSCLFALEFSMILALLFASAVALIIMVPELGGCTQFRVLPVDRKLECIFYLIATPVFAGNAVIATMLLVFVLKRKLRKHTHGER